MTEEEARNTRLNLPQIRRNRGVSLRSIAENTKIRIGYLEAIEAEEFGSLPGEIYSTSYIRQYARAIDYDETPILSLFCERRGVCPSLFEEPAPDQSLGQSLVDAARLAGRRCRRFLLKPLLP